MIYDIKEFLKRFFGSRLFVLAIVFILMFSMVLIRVFSLQIVNGADYQKNFTMKIQKTLTDEAARGNIYDCEGRLLAYNELAYAVTYYDSGTYSTTWSRNKQMNAELAQLIEVIERNGEEITNNFYIAYDEETDTYEYTVSGTKLRRFLADVFGETSYEKLSFNTELGFDEANATAEQVMDFLMHHSRDGFGVRTLEDQAANRDEKPERYDYYPEKLAYEIVVLRYAINENRYTKYKSTKIAEDVSDRTVAYMNEHSDTLPGVEIEEETVRRYNYSEYFSSIIGYTGRISDSEYEKLSAKDTSYTTNDIIGKTGLEQYYESYLRGKNGEKEVYVDSLGKISEIISMKDSVAGNNLYLSIDAELQKATYLLLEQELAGILYSNIKSGNIPINDVFFALINNNIIDIQKFNLEDASETEQMLFRLFEMRKEQALKEIEGELFSSTPLINNDMSPELLDYFTCAISLLKDKKILITSAIDVTDNVYLDWRNGKLSPREYLSYCITNQCIDISALNVGEKYADSTEIYAALCNDIIEGLKKDKSFSKSIYKYMLEDGQINGQQLCLILFDQGVISYNVATVNGLRNKTIDPQDFLMEKINNIEITPAQLALDPCTGSCVLTDIHTGEIKALVSYPGFDNNRLANGVDAEYFARINEDLSNPQYNYATQEKTACGSTFKMVTATAGLAEHVINLETEIECLGQFTLISNQPKCWIFPKTHSFDNVSEALRDSCNYFFYTVGYNLSMKGSGVYNDAVGISYIQKYASIYGLDQKTGIEIEENTPEIADSFPVMAAIGQSNNNYTTISLARYVTAVASGKLYDYRLMNKIEDSAGNIVKSYEPSYSDISYVLNQAEWDAIHSGMRMVCESSKNFKGFEIAVAGKTGTAQQIKTRPNHALFVGYAPYENPEITIATRIAYGYTSHNTADFTRSVFSYYFNVNTLDELLSRNAEGANASSSNSSQD